MRETKSCTVALLRPPETSYTAFFQQQALEDEGTESAQIYSPHIDEWCDGFREKIAEIGEEEGIPTEIQEHQLHQAVALPGRGHRRALRKEADIITTIDPPPHLAAFVLGTVHEQPNMRFLLAYSTRDALESAFDLIGTAKVPVLITREVRVGLIILLERETSLRMIPKVFAFLYRNEDQMHTAVTQALRYPDCRDVAAQWHSFMPETSFPHNEQD
ncbi:MAG: hypothetical protein V1876_01090 [Candidatus Peregrinibacteria bacterium]